MDGPMNSFDFKAIVTEEIALEGLQGIGIKQLWIRVKNKISSEITFKMQNRLWNYIRDSQTLRFYETEEPAPIFEILDRFSIVDDVNGHLTDSEEYIDGPYTYVPVPKEYGSCSNYKTRVEISNNKIKTMSYEDLLTLHGDNFVIVASIEERWHALAPHKPFTLLSYIAPIQYCILELIGKSRENGQTTVGKTNLKLVIPEAKGLFYTKTVLKKNGLIVARKVNCVTQKNYRTVILRLIRFHRPRLGDSPRVGLISIITEYLKTRPGYSDSQNVLVKKGVLTNSQVKKLCKSASFKFTIENPTESPGNSKKNLHLKNRNVSLITETDESSSSSGEEQEDSIKCEYKVGVDLLRQAYERFMDAGLNGLTIIQLTQKLGVEFYTARSISNIFKKKKILREVLEDRGRQRISKLVAVTATGSSESEYTKEKRKLMGFLETSRNHISSSEEHEVPNKKIKLETKPDNLTGDSESSVMEIKTLKGIETDDSKTFIESCSNLTLRQIRLANAILMVTREQLAVPGFQVLSSQLCKASTEPPMDNKSLKRFTMKLVKDGHVKLFQIKWPGFTDRETTMICAFHVAKDDAVIRAKVKEISLRAAILKTSYTAKSNNAPVVRKFYAEYRYPRYMRAKTLHEFLTKYVYFDDVKHEFGKLPHGCAYLVNIIPEITVEFAMGNMHYLNMSCINKTNSLESVLKLKLRDAPQEIQDELLSSNSLKNSLRANLQILATFGLIQLIAQSTVETTDFNSPIFSYVFYVNRSVKIIDTVGNWPREVKDISALEHTFHFDSFKDVQNYWETVYNISVNTRVRKDLSRDKKIKHPPLTRIDSIIYDKPVGPIGDGKGPCGYDSSYFVECPKFWSMLPLKRPFKVQPGKPDILKRITVPKKRKVLKKKKKLVKSTNTRTKVRRRYDFPLVWTEQDDKILNMLRVAMAVMNSTPQPGSLRVRNKAAYTLLNYINKDTKKWAGSYHKRFKQIDGNAFLNYEKQQLLGELRRHKNLIQPYEGFFKKIKHKLISEKQSADLSLLKMLELLWIINGIAENRSFEKIPPCVAVDYTDFFRKFSISLKSDKDMDLSYGSISDSIRIGVLKELIMSTIICSHVHEADVKNSMSVFSVVTKYPEIQLREAMDHLKCASAIALREKTVYNFLCRSKCKGQDLIKMYRPCKKYVKKCVTLSEEFIVNLAAELFKEAASVSCYGSAEIVCMLSELFLRGALGLVFVTTPIILPPPNSFIQDDPEDTRMLVKSGTVGFYLQDPIEKFCDLYQDIDVPSPSEISNRFMIRTDSKREIDVTDILLSHLKEKADSGATLTELRGFFTYDYNELTNKLTLLEERSLIKRVGYYENRIVHVNFIKQWTIKTKDSHLIPAPWMKMSGNIIPEVFIDWTSTVLYEVFKRPGSSVATLSLVCEFITYKAVHEICEFLLKSECIYMKTFLTNESDLFSDSVVEEDDYSKYEDFSCIHVYPVQDAIVKYSYVKKMFCDKHIVKSSSSKTHEF